MKSLNDNFSKMKIKNFNDFSSAVIHSKLFTYFLWYCLTFFLLRIYSLFVGCVLWRLTGVICPGCGATRAIFSLCRLDFSAYLDYNAFALPILICSLLGVHLPDLMPYISKRVVRFIYVFFSVTAILVFLYWFCRLCGLIETSIYSPKSLSLIISNLCGNYFGN